MILWTPLPQLSQGSGEYFFASVMMYAAMIPVTYIILSILFRDELKEFERARLAKACLAWPIIMGGLFAIAIAETIDSLRK